METPMAFVIGAMVAGSVYLLLSHNVLRLLFGVMLLSNAINLAVFFIGGLSLGLPPLIPAGAETLNGPYSNPLPQALVLTAIVIGFGLLSFALVLVYRGYQELGTLESGRMRAAEPPFPDDPGAPSRTDRGTGAREDGS